MVSEGDSVKSKSSAVNVFSSPRRICSYVARTARFHSSSSWQLSFQVHYNAALGRIGGCERRRIVNYRTLGRTGWKVSEISFGAWAIGGAWGTVHDEDSLDALRAALDAGVNFVDTADVYGDGRSERLIARILKERRDRIYVATKAGRRLDPHLASGYTRANLTAFIERSLKNLETEALDLLQLHCPPTEIYYRPEVFDFLDDMVKAGKIRCYGVSVEKVEEAIKAIEFPNVQTVQIIFNMFRRRPAELFFDLAKKRRVGILARVPLASGLLSGKMTVASAFARDDHRNFNALGEAFDVGETFAGVKFQTGLGAVERLKPLVPAGASLSQFALRWILMFDAITCAIPGAKTRTQALENIGASALTALSDPIMAEIRSLYDETIRTEVHARW
jgi:aryl-alcohol dehydrogenase-like predicted oxidoreductase